MITTNEQHEVQPFSFMRTPGFKSWRAVGVDISKTYFLLNFACKEGRTWVSQGMMLWDDEDLLGLCVQARESTSKKIYQIAKLMPPKSGQSAIWRWSAIKEIWRCQDERGEEVILYMTDDSEQEISHRTAIDQSRLKQVEQLFVASKKPVSILS
ncbi:hypothetical protein [Duganella sp. S19_KUP01_CR8]|uniref:hypothetical protein n=1 Tax=Duganella sp. S19_KUP01_CR8 TaxID=3025502 RepID=UPI002FCD88B9